MQQNSIVADVNRLSIEELHTHGNIGVFECLIKKAGEEDELLPYIIQNKILGTKHLHQRSPLKHA